MNSTPISCFYDDSATGTVTVYGGPCVLKGVQFAYDGGVPGTPDAATFINILDGSTELFKLFLSFHNRYVGSSSGMNMPGLGVRIDTALKFSTDTDETLRAVSVFYQA